MTSITSCSRVLVVGLDGATFDLISPWVAEGKLPTFARLMEEGCYGSLESVIHPYTAQAWTTFMTGTNPGKHRIFDWRERDFSTYGYRFLNARSRVGKSLWQILSEAGKRCIVVNVPMTYPPEPVNGVLVSGRDTPGMDAEYTYPQEVKKELLRVLGKYVIVPDDWLWMRRNRPDKARDELFEEINVRLAATKYLMDKYPWDFSMVVFSATDGAGHFFWKYHDPDHPLFNPSEAAKYKKVILEIYQRCDEILARFLDRLGPDGILVVASDHGMGSAGNRAIHLNVWLEQKGFLCFTESEGFGSLNVWTSREFARALRVGKEVFQRTVPWQLQVKLNEKFGSVRERLEKRAFFPDIDWSRTRAYSEEIRGNIWINLKGREPQGIIEPGAEYEATRDSIIEQLTDTRDPATGEKVIERVYRREEVYNGPFVELFPDLVALPRDSVLVWKARNASRLEQPVRRLPNDELARIQTTGGHFMNGVLMMHGAPFKKGVELSEASLPDVLPTILYLMGLPVPSYLDGRVLVDAIRQEHLSRSPVCIIDVDYTPHISDSSEDDYSESEVAEVEERLKGLGYL